MSANPAPLYEAPDFVALLEEIPLLAGARRFARSLASAGYLSRLGQPLDAGERALARAFLDGLGFPDAESAAVANWEEAGDAALALDADPEGWEAEEMLRAALTGDALSRLDETGLGAALALVAEAAAQGARDGAREAAALWDLEDEGLLTAAVGAGVQAAHCGALALIALDAEEAARHPFVLRHTLFARGRWPIGLAGRTLNIF